MTSDTFTLTDVERACGVTLQDVTTTRMRGYVTADGRTFVAGSGMSPAVCGAAARMALGGPVDFSHLDAATRMPVYRLAGA